ncbi:tRNA glutamyl-Q(34) synthetase GluQRS [Pseudovibrio sp. Tun.PSC04-5.I4]|uniref:tRNA glutamyl-Q(34) synthetase GluQRS n=1 Tax=Pseudovibrio sp. Tun.PSC04-5.I4 TaxID=1798213 RepID=UPI0008832084|nr:tRNA glutamyl-Q(34) synthetase GluQRS [Pseudovibrio sp. Tun.PSC04-5.I4]SDR27675.1 glutamyl-Q tRNA(Asp) synthetase [Pseudovibrio sp. Tun.PSC04-5.I4]
MNLPVYRFAPSPNGHLHLGHAYSAILNQRAAQKYGGKLLLRVEDIDTIRCTPQLQADMLEDLHWLGIQWEEPVRKQSEHFEDYQCTLHKLEERSLVYKAYLTRAQIKRFVAQQDATGTPWPRDPDGAPLYPGDDKVLSAQDQQERQNSDAPYALRLNMEKAIAAVGQPLRWQEARTGKIQADPAAWGDVVLARKDTPTSYHLSVVVDDALQGITHILRGTDLYHATSVHRLLQTLLNLPEPLYEHHHLIMGADGRKLAKSAKDTSLRELRASGVTPAQIREMLSNPASEQTTARS